MPASDDSRLAESGAAAEKRSGSDVASVVSECMSRTAWIEVQLVGGNGIGLADHRYLLTLPDGSVRQGKTDSKGLLRVTEIPAEDRDHCSISFPDLDEAAWEVAD